MVWEPCTLCHPLAASGQKKKKQQLKLYAKLTPVELHCVNSINAATIPKYVISKTNLPIPRASTDDNCELLKVYSPGVRLNDSYGKEGWILITRETHAHCPLLLELSGQFI